MHWNRNRKRNRNRNRKRAPCDSRTTVTAPAPWQLWASSCCFSPWAESSPSSSGFSSGDGSVKVSKDADESRLWWQIMMGMKVSNIQRRWLGLKTSFSGKYLFLGKSSLGLYFSRQEKLNLKLWFSVNSNFVNIVFFISLLTLFIWNFLYFILR